MNNHNYRGGCPKGKDTFEASPIQVKACPANKLSWWGEIPTIRSLTGGGD